MKWLTLAAALLWPVSLQAAALGSRQAVEAELKGVARRAQAPDAYARFIRALPSLDALSLPAQRRWLTRLAGARNPLLAARAQLEAARFALTSGDPVAARGRLREAGIAVEVGLMQGAAESLNAGFISRVQRGRPRVRLKVAASLDGATAMNSGVTCSMKSPMKRAKP